jgi:hypothetical protein
MKTANAALALLLSMAAGLAQAENWYLGASVGRMTTNLSHYDNNADGNDDAVNAGALLGYDVYTRGLAAFSLEGELTTTVAKGSASLGGSHDEWGINTQAAYLAMRLGDRLYMKVRYGVLHEDVSVKGGGNSHGDTDTGGSWGAALGWMVTPKWGIQADGTVVDPNISYWNLGVKYYFH